MNYIKSIIRILITSVLLIFTIQISYAQISPSLNIISGFSIPAAELTGDLITSNDSGYSFINPAFVRDNYANSTGVLISGNLKIPIEKSGIVNLLFSGSYSFFNVFRRTALGTTIRNNIVIPASYSSRFSVSTFGLGMEIMPLPNAKFSPFINSNFTFNILSLSLAENEFINAIFSDAFRMGVLSSAGMYIKLNHEYSLVLGCSYHLSNLLLRSNEGSLNESVVFGRDNNSINDEEGVFYTNLSSTETFPQQVNGKRKNANWWNINIGINIVLGKSVKK